MPNLWAGEDVNIIRALFGDCGGTNNGIITIGGPNNGLTYEGRWNSAERKRTKYTRATFGGIRARILDDVDRTTLFKFVIENLHEFHIERTPESASVLVQGWIGNFSAFEWFFPETMAQDMGVQVRQGTEIGLGAQARLRTFIRQKKLLYGGGQDLGAGEGSKLADLLDAIGDMLAYQTYAQIPLSAYKKLPFPIRVAEQIIAMDFLTHSTGSTIVGEGIVSRPVGITVECFPVDSSSLVNLAARQVELNGLGVPARRLCDVLLYDAFLRCTGG